MENQSLTPKEIELHEATVNDVIGSDVLNKQADHVFAFHCGLVKLTECVAAPSRYGLIDSKTKQVNEVAHLIYRAFEYAIDEIAKEDDVPISHRPDIQEMTWEWLFAYKNHDGDICLACTEHIMRGNVDHYELWYRDPKGIKHVFMRLVVDNPGHITVYEGDRGAVTHVSARAKVKVKALVDEYNNQRKPEEPEELKKIAEEHDKEVLSEFCDTLKEFSEEYADSWLINTTNFRGVKKMTFAKLRTIVLSWISQNIMCNDIFSTVTTSCNVPGVPIKITVTEFGIKRDLSINFNNDQTEFTIYEGFFGIINSRVITIKSDEKTNSQDVEFNNNCRFTDFSRERMLSLYNTICTEMGKESNAASAFTPPSVANVVNRYGNMSASPRYEVKDAFEMADGSKVITGLNLLSMNIVKPRNRDLREWVRIIPRIKSILFNEKKKVTTIIWNDNTKTMAKCTADDVYDEEIGVAICIAKKYYDNNQNQMRKEINKFKTRQKKREDAVQKRLDKKNKSTEIIDNKPNEVEVDDNTDNIIG